MRHWQCPDNVCSSLSCQGQSTCEALQVCSVPSYCQSIFQNLHLYLQAGPLSSGNALFAILCLFLQLTDTRNQAGPGPKREHNYGFQFIPRTLHQCQGLLGIRPAAVSPLGGVPNWKCHKLGMNFKSSSISCFSCCFWRWYVDFLWMEMGYDEIYSSSE